MRNQQKTYLLHRFLTSASVLVLLAACSGGTSLNYPAGSNNANQGQSLAPPTSQTPPTPAPTTNPPPVVASYEPLAWETAASRSSTKSWSDYLFQTILTKTPQLLNGASDITNFCPKYDSLDQTQKINFWGMLVSAISKYESDFNPLSRMEETTMGTDPVTGLPVYSEGLMQLSYQDILSYPFCQFDWNTDKNLSPTDPLKTILDPLINLDCGVQILAWQISKHNVIAAPAAFAYWSTLIPGGKYTALTQIQNETKTLSFCQ